jgi:hypothetical protein
VLVSLNVFFVIPSSSGKGFAMNASERLEKARSSKGRIVGTAIAAVAVTGILTQVAPALAHGSSSAAVVKATVYQGKVVNQNTVLGPQSSPTTLTSTAVLPAGTYLVTAIVGAVISPQDQIVCAVSNVRGRNDGVFGTAGNPAAGTAGIYGTATMTDTVRVSTGQRLWLGCNSFNFGKGTYASDAVIEAVPATVH